jgi:hypothetical protein
VAFVDGLMKDLGLPIGTLGSGGALSFRDFPQPEKPGGAPRKLGKGGKDDD